MTTLNFQPGRSIFTLLANAFDNASLPTIQTVSRIKQQLAQAHRQNDHMQAAQLCERLAKRSKRGSAQRMQWQIEAGNAYRQAAMQLSMQPSHCRQQLTQLWQQAADLYRLADEMDTLQICEAQLIVLCERPKIEVQLEIVGSLIEETWGMLRITARNRGYGRAYRTTIDVTSDLLEGEDIVEVLQFGHLDVGEVQEREIQIRPKSGAVGTAVPVDLIIRYLRPDDHHETQALEEKMTVIHQPQFEISEICPVIRAKWKAVGDALIDAFDLSHFEKMLRHKLGLRLDRITTTQTGFDAIVWATIQWAVRTNKLSELIAVAKAYNPTNRQLQALPS